MARYNKKIVERICDLISKDSYTVREICNIVGIAESTFYNWKSKKVEFSEAIKKAQDKFDEMIVVEAKKSLLKQIKGYTVIESKTITVDTGHKTDDGKPIVKVKEYVKTEKHVQPNVAATIFALTNKDSDNWQNKQNTEVTGKGGKDLIPARILTKKEAKELLDNLEEEY